MNLSTQRKRPLSRGWSSAPELSAAAEGSSSSPDVAHGYGRPVSRLRPNPPPSAASVLSYYTDYSAAHLPPATARGLGLGTASAAASGPPPALAPGLGQTMDTSESAGAETETANMDVNIDIWELAAQFCGLGELLSVATCCTEWHAMVEQRLLADCVVRQFGVAAANLKGVTQHNEAVTGMGGGGGMSASSSSSSLSSLATTASASWSLSSSSLSTSWASYTRHMLSFSVPSPGDGGCDEERGKASTHDQRHRVLCSDVVDGTVAAYKRLGLDFEQEYARDSYINLTVLSSMCLPVFAVTQPLYWEVLVGANGNGNVLVGLMSESYYDHSQTNAAANGYDYPPAASCAADSTTLATTAQVGAGLPAGSATAVTTAVATAVSTAAAATHPAIDSDTDTGTDTDAVTDGTADIESEDEAHDQGQGRGQGQGQGQGPGRRTHRRHARTGGPASADPSSSPPTPAARPGVAAAGPASADPTITALRRPLTFAVCANTGELYVEGRQITTTSKGVVDSGNGNSGTGGSARAPLVVGIQVYHDAVSGYCRIAFFIQRFDANGNRTSSEMVVPHLYTPLTWGDNIRFGVEMCVQSADRGDWVQARGFRPSPPAPTWVHMATLTTG